VESIYKILKVARLTRSEGVLIALDGTSRFGNKIDGCLTDKETLLVCLYFRWERVDAMNFSGYSINYAKIIGRKNQNYNSIGVYK
jgi:hypothetical protein